MATNPMPVMVTSACTVCGGPNTRPEEAAIHTACPACLRVLLCVANGIPVEIPPAVAAALAAA